MSIKKIAGFCFVMLLLGSIIGCGAKNSAPPAPSPAPQTNQENKAENQGKVAEKPAENQNQGQEEEHGGLTALKDGAYTGVGQGFGGPIRLEVTIVGGKIKEIEVIEAQETENIGGKAITSLISTVKTEQTSEVATISGATKSTKGFVEALEDALEQASK